MGGNGHWKRGRGLAIAAVCLAAMAALPPAAGAVLSGTNGRIVYIGGPAFGNTQLFLRSVTSSTGAGSTTGPLATGLTQQHRHPTWSPDRTKIAFAEGPGGATGYDIYIFDLTTPGATPQNITNSSGVTDDRPAWSPDGTRIAYESGSDIIVHPLNGGGDLNLTSTLTPKAWKAAWSPDSQTLYYSVGDITQPPNGTTNDVKLYQQPANNSSAGTELLHVSGAHVFQPSISPDGTKLCYTFSTGAGNSTSAAIHAASLSAPASFTPIEESGKGDYNCTWSPDGTKIAYVEDYAENGEIFMKNSDGSGIPIDLTNTAGVFDGNPDWAPDGRPRCQDTTVTTQVNTPVSIPIPCADTGPAYEQTSVRALVLNGSGPTHGSVSTPDPQLLPASITYTPNTGFLGTDSFKLRSFDEVAFGDRDGTVTVNVQPAPQGHGTQGTPRVRCAGRVSTIVGTARADTITGTPRPDVISSLGGNDKVKAGGGNDVVCGGGGKDKLFGQGGKDKLFGQGGKDNLKGGGGKDTCNGGKSTDVASACEVRKSI